VLLNGLKAAALPVYACLLDTTTFNPSAPDDPTAWSIAYSLDTVFRHATPGAAIRADSTFAAASQALDNRSAPLSGYPIAINPASSTVACTVHEGGKGEFSIYSCNGRVVAQKHAVIMKTQESFQWREMGRLPAGMYYLQIKVNNKVLGNIKFCKI
jgi:hypothetical protein